MAARASKKSWRELSRGLLWPRVAIGEDQLRWWRRHPEIPPAPINANLDGSVISHADPESGLVWLRTTVGLLPCIRWARGELYDPREAYIRAVQKRDPYASPHATFRGIRNPYQAIQFLRDFGPLTKDTDSVILVDEPEAGEGDRLGWFVNLERFFRCQREFRAIVEFWDALPDDERLQSIWLSFSDHSDSPFHLEWNWDLKYWAVVEGLSFYSEPWRKPGELSPAEWLKKASCVPELRDLTYALIVRTVERYAAGKVQWQIRPDESGRPTFTPGVEIESLWSAMWEFFALDTVGGITWRICPHCGKVFSPPRKDRLFCTARLQQLHSKREWWRKSFTKKVAKAAD
jgi:hypothetical protein